MKLKFAILILFLAGFTAAQQSVSVQSVNSPAVGLYEKFEVFVKLEGFTWDGYEFSSSIGISSDSNLTVQLPSAPANNPDLAFIVTPIGKGGSANALTLLSDVKEILASDRKSVKLTCLVRDEKGNITSDTRVPLNVRVEGPGFISSGTPVNVDGGFAEIEYTASNELGTASIIAESAGLIADTVKVSLVDQISIDDFEDYISYSDLDIGWQVRAGTKAQMYLDKNYKSKGLKSLRLVYAIGNGNPPDAGIITSFSNDYYH